MHAAEVVTREVEGHHGRVNLKSSRERIRRAREAGPVVSASSAVHVRSPQSCAFFLRRVLLLRADQARP
jgi:hypothetical protein